MVFNPVVVENYSDCNDSDTSWLPAVKTRGVNKRDPELIALAEGLESYSDKSPRKYIHMVDGGITDNMGLRSFYDIITVSGGAKEFIRKTNELPPKESY